VIPVGGPPDPRVLHDGAAGEVPVLPEVRVVDLEQVAEVLADVAVPQQALRRTKMS